MIETVTDKSSYERLCISVNQTKKGWYSEADGFVSFERIKEQKRIQSDLKSRGIIVTLKEEDKVIWNITNPPELSESIPYKETVL